MAEFIFYVFMDWDDVEVNKNPKKERGEYSTILPNKLGQ